MIRYLFIIVITLLAVCLFQFCASDPTIAVMSFNIRYDNPDDGVHSWANRKDNVVELIRHYNPDVLGLQEALSGQITYLNDHLPDYHWIGVGRDDGETAGEYSPVFCKKDRFELIKSDYFWLSETPEQAGSMGWDAACPRIVTWVHLIDKNTAKNLFIFNTHFDHLGKNARINSAQYLRTFVNQTAGDHYSIIMGDFNANDSSKVYQILTGDNMRPLADTKKISASGHVGPEWTFQGFSKDVDKKKLDYIFVGGNIKVNHHEYIQNPEFGEYPSDHLPVFIEIEVVQK